MTKNIIRLAIIVGLLLLIPVFGNMYVEGWNWSPFDFVWAFVVLFGAGFIFIYISSKASSLTYKLAVGLGVLTGLALVWGNAAVGLIGDDNPTNLMYFGVLLIGLIGAFIARFKAHGMSYALVATALAQLLVPVIAYFVLGPDKISWAPGVPQVFILNSCFALSFLVSALLFRHATKTDLK